MLPILRYFLLWFPMIVLAVLNGTARDLWYSRYTGALAGHQISTVSLLILLGIYMYIVLNIYPPDSALIAAYTGILWLVLTLFFEFGLGRLRGKSWAVLFQDYNVVEGKIWPLVLLWIAFAPWLFYKIVLGH